LIFQAIVNQNLVFRIDISSNWILLAFLLAGAGMARPERTHCSVRHHLNAVIIFELPKLK
jgi:hypothetical protein